MSGTLNICIVAPGEFGFLYPIARALVREGHRVTILSWKNKSRFDLIEHQGVKAYFLGEGASLPRSEFPELVLRKFEQLHGERPFDLLHSLDASGVKVGRRRKRLGVATVFDVDATHMAQIYSILGMSQESLGSLIRTSWRVAIKFLKTYWRYDRKLLKTADAVFVHSPQQRVILERYYVYPDQRIFTVPFGLEVEDLSPRERSDELMKKLGLPAHAQTLVTVTDMSEFSEMRNLLSAFERVAIKKPNARLIIVGTGPFKKEIEFEMLQLALGSRVIFAGEVPSAQLADYIAVADVFVNLSARSSGIERSLLEAMAQKKIIVGSEVSPLINVVEDGVDGFLVRPADTFTLAELFLQILNGQIEVEVMGEHARQKVLNLFDSTKMLSQTLLAYRQARERFVTAHRPWFSLARARRAP